MNKDAAVFEGVAVDRIVEVAIAQSRRPPGELTEYRPFAGLVSSEPRRALDALLSSAARGEYPRELWKSLISDWPDDLGVAESTGFYTALMHLPAPVVQDLHHYLSRWMQDRLPLTSKADHTLALSIFDALLDGLLAGGDAVAESGLIPSAAADAAAPPSRRTLDLALNGSIGHATIAWIKMLEAQKPAAGSELPAEYSTRIERLLTAPGEGSDHAISILGWQMNWLNWVTPKWVAQRLIPCLAPDHPAAEPLWSGVFGLHQIPNPELFSTMKEQLLALFPKLYGWNWENSRYEPAHDWLVLACLDHSRDPAYVSHHEALACIRQFTPEGRTHAIYYLGQFGRGNPDAWVEGVIPFIRNAWPQETRFQVEATSAAFLSLLDDAGDSFPELYGAIRPHLRPISGSRHGLYGFYKLSGDTKEPVTAKFPDLVLDVINCVTPDDPRLLPYDMPRALAAIVEAKPSLSRDVRFVRLSNLVANQ